MTLSRGARLGPYEIVSPLGSGGMGEIYRARDVRLGREVAVKVLPEELSEDAERLSRFKQEARAASALNHPNIVVVHDVGRSDSISYIAMELVEGRTLRDRIAAGSLPVRRVLSLAAQIAEGLAKAHSAGIVHRDLKPENVVVTEDGFVKILDFGLARMARPSAEQLAESPTASFRTPRTETGIVLGTVGYMSPEQAAGRVVDHRSDQFSLGAILYEMVTGLRPFRGDTPAQTLAAIIEKEPQPVVALRADAPAPLVWLIERCLSKAPSERYESTRDLARELESMRDHISGVTSGAEAAAAVPLRGKGRLFRVLAGAGLLLLGALTYALLERGLGEQRGAYTPSFRRLTFRHGKIHNARFASDGQTILYGAMWEGDRSRLYLTRLESPESRPFDFGSDSADILSTSSSGEMAILLNERPVAGGVLARVPMAGGIPRQVLEDVSYAGADWAPDGRNLVVAHRSGNIRQLEYPIGRVLTKTPSESPRFSPSGKLIAFFKSGRTQAVSIIDSSGKNHRVLSEGWSSILGAPGWRPDGKEIWFTASRGGQPEALYGVTLSGKVRLIIRVPGNLELDDVSRDGRVLAAHHTMIHAVLGRHLTEEKERNLSWMDVSEPEDLSADGKTLVLTERGEGSSARPAVYLRHTDGSPAVKLGEGRAMALSPDGNWVLAEAGMPGEPQNLILLPTGAGESRTLPGGQFFFYLGAAWFADGKRIVFTAAERGRPWRIYIQSVEGGSPRPLGPEGVRLRPGTRLLSPDGKWVLGTQERGKALLIPVDGGEPRPVTGLEDWDVPLCWSEDGRSFYLRGGEPPSDVPPATTKIWRLDPMTGQRRFSSEIRLSEPIPLRWRFLLTPDAKTYVYYSRKTYSELYLIEGLK